MKAGWTGSHTGAGGALTPAVAAGAPGGGNALLATIPIAGSGISGYAYDVEVFGGAQGFHAELEINVPTFAQDGDVFILQLSGPGSVNESGVGVVLRNKSPKLGLYLAKGDGNADSPQANIELPRDQWVHVALDLSFGASGRLRLLLNGATAWDAAFVTEVTAAPELRVGLQRYNGATPLVSARYDTVRVDVVP